MRILFIGDVVGRAGRHAVDKYLPDSILKWRIDFTVVNGENSADNGFGITEEIYNEMIAAGADAVTLGNHSWNRREALLFIDRAPRLLRPINYLPGAPGKGAAVIKARTGSPVLVISALGRLFMDPVQDPFSLVEQELTAYSLTHSVSAAIVDCHCEATSEKQAMGHFCDGRASLVAGTHTHTPTADHQILPRGTGYMTDAGMTGDYDSVVGMQKGEAIRRFTTGISAARLEPAAGMPTLCGIAVETDDSTGLAVRIAPVRLGGRLEEAMPVFWISD